MCVIVLATADMSPLLWTWLNARGSFICTATFSSELINIKENMRVQISPPTPPPPPTSMKTVETALDCGLTGACK